MNFIKRLMSKKDKCPYCGGKVLFKPATSIGYQDLEKHVYVCENYFKDKEGYPAQSIDESLRMCSAYVLAHAHTSRRDNVNSPLGRMANSDLRKVHSKANKAFLKMWKGDEGRLVNEVWGYVLEYKNDSGEVVYGFLESTNTLDNAVTLKIIGSGDTEDLDGVMVTVPSDRVDVVRARTKAYVWLAKEMDMNLDGFTIQNLDYEQTIKAINIINYTVKNYLKYENR